MLRLQLHNIAVASLCPFAQRKKTHAADFPIHWRSSWFLLRTGSLTKTRQVEQKPTPNCQIRDNTRTFCGVKSDSKAPLAAKKRTEIGDDASLRCSSLTLATYWVERAVNETDTSLGRALFEISRSEIHVSVPAHSWVQLLHTRGRRTHRPDGQRAGAPAWHLFCPSLIQP